MDSTPARWVADHPPRRSGRGPKAAYVLESGRDSRACAASAPDLRRCRPSNQQLFAPCWVCGTCHGWPVVLGMPIRRNQRKCEPIPAQNELCTVYLIPNSWHVCSTSLDIAG